MKKKTKPRQPRRLPRKNVPAIALKATMACGTTLAKYPRSAQILAVVAMAELLGVRLPTKK